MIQKQFSEMKDRLGRLEEEKQGLQLERAQLQQKIAEYSQTMPTESSTQPILAGGPPSFLAATPLTQSRMKAILNKPDKFAGDRKSYPVWKSNMATKIRIDGTTMGLSDTTVVAYMASFCEKEAGMYLHSYETRIANGTLEYNEFWAVMDARYDDPHRQKRAAIDFKNFKQSNKPFAEFLAEFEGLSSEAEYDVYPDPVKIQQLEEKLSAELRQLAISGVTEEDLASYPTFVRKLHVLDNRLKAAKLDGAFKFSLSGGQPKGQSVAFRRQSPPPPRKTSDDPMDWTPSSNKSSTRQPDPRSPLPERMQNITERELRARQQRKACFTCGNTGHIARDCGYAPPRNRVRLNQTHTTLPEPVWCDPLNIEDPEQDKDQGKEQL
jgi:hypothetical protein